MKSWFAAAVLISIGAAAACSSSGGTGTTSGGGGEGGAGATTGNGTMTTGSGTMVTSSASGTMTTTTGAGPTTTTGTGMMTCADEPDYEACATCCDDETMGGYEAFATPLLLACACEQGGAGGGGVAAAPCLAECDTMDPASDLCPAAGMVNLMAMNQACITCMNGLMMGEACFEEFGPNCDQKCQDFLACTGDCPPP